MQRSITSTPYQASGRRGFTIVELLIVIVVIGILAAITIVAYNGVQQRAQAATVQSDLEGAAKQLAMDQVTNSAYPATLAAANNGAGLKASPGTTYQYAVNNTTNPQTYCITATNVTTSYFVSSTNNIPTSGACPGQGAGGVAAITNLMTNPSFETDTSSWIGANGATFVQSSAAAMFGNYGVRVTSGDNAIDSGIGVSNLTVSAGTTYTYSATVRPVTAGIYSLSVQGSYGSATQNATLASGQVQRISVTLTATGTGNPSIYVLRAGGQTSGVYTFDVDGVMVTQGSTLYNYADGNSPNWIWNGTPNASTSTGSPL